MGCGSSKQKIVIRRHFVINEKRSGQGRDALRDFRTIGMTDAEIDYLFNIFLLIDKENCGEVSVAELCTYFEIERSPYSDRLFEHMDMDKSGEVDFHEFLLVLWFYASLDTRALSDFVFMLYDKDKDGLLTRVEVSTLIQEVYGRLYEANPHVVKLVRHVDNKSEDYLNQDTFRALTLEYALLLYPTFRIQQLMRKKVFDEEFWLDQLKERMKKDVNMTTTVLEVLSSIKEFDKAQVGGMSVAKKKRPGATPIPAKVVVLPGGPAGAASGRKPGPQAVASRTGAKAQPASQGPVKGKAG